MKNEAKALLDSLEAAFRDVSGPPSVTLSVARGFDDHDEDIARQRTEHAHHTHWTKVSEEEIQKYHDCWFFMDAEAIRFYVPAFIASHLRRINSGDPKTSLGNADWLPENYVEFFADKAPSFSTEQQVVVRQYLDFLTSA